MEVPKCQLLPSQLVIGATSAVSTAFARGFAWIATGTERGVYVHRGAVVGANQYVYPGLSSQETHNTSHGAQPTLADNSFTLWQHITLPQSPPLPPAAACHSVCYVSKSSYMHLSCIDCLCGMVCKWLHSVCIVVQPIFIGRFFCQLPQRAPTS